MKITILYFASLREAVGSPSNQLETDNPLTANQAWNISTNKMERPSNTLISVNQEYVNAETLLNDGDELAFFPPVTGG